MQPTVYLLSCGDELLFGHTVDTNSAWLAEQCTSLGWRILGHRTVGDVTPDIISAFLYAASLADVVILTGGLGPTQDDRTRHALAHALGTDLVEDPDALAEIEAIFKRFNRPMGTVNQVQALIPRTAQRIVNPNGTAPGIQANLYNAKIFCMPGVPREMREMFKQTIKPYMRKAEGASYEVMRRLHLCGRGESDIGAALKHLMGERSNPEVGTAVAESIITVRMYAKGDSLEDATRVADRAEADIRALLGNDVFGTEGQTMGEAVVGLLKERKAYLITAESCTGGMVSSMIVDVAGASDVFLEGIVSYSNASKMRRLGVPAATLEQFGAVSRETAAAMAELPLRSGEFPGFPVYSVSTTGVAGPDGGTPEKPVGLVWIACSRLEADGSGITRTMRYNTLTDRNGVRMRASYAALDLLRRTMLEYPSEYKVETTRWKKG